VNLKGNHLEEVQEVALHPREDPGSGVSRIMLITPLLGLRTEHTLLCKALSRSCTLTPGIFKRFLMKTFSRRSCQSAPTTSEAPVSRSMISNRSEASCRNASLQSDARRMGVRGWLLYPVWFEKEHQYMSTGVGRLFLPGLWILSDHPLSQVTRFFPMSLQLLQLHVALENIRLSDVFLAKRMLAVNEGIIE
jgi:hypothetical protein